MKNLWLVVVCVVAMMGLFACNSGSLSSANLGKTAATAYDATHGFSDQFIVEIEVFNKAAAAAGLFPVEKHFTKFPNSELGTVSINLLKRNTTL